MATPTYEQSASTAAFALALAMRDWNWAKRLLANGALPDRCKAHALACSDVPRVCAMLSGVGVIFSSEDFLTTQEPADLRSGERASLAPPSGVAYLLSMGLAPSLRALVLAAKDCMVDEPIFLKMMKATPKPWPGSLASACKACHPEKINSLLQAGVDPSDVLGERSEGFPSALESCFLVRSHEPERRERSISSMLARFEMPKARLLRSIRGEEDFHYELDEAESSANLAKNVAKLNLSGCARQLAEGIWNEKSGSESIKARNILLNNQRLGLADLAERDALRASVASSPSQEAAKALRI